MIQRVKDEGAEVMVATHNQYSVETAVAEMHELDLCPDDFHIYFGQLLGKHIPTLPDLVTRFTCLQEKHYTVHKMYNCLVSDLPNANRTSIELL